MKLPTTDIWTSGISNVPKDNRNARYTFFELDTKDIDKVHFVLDVYRANLGSCYVHELINGYHFYNFQLIDKLAYNRIIKQIKHLNKECPLTVLRIIPNKWQNEKRYWNKEAMIRPNQELEDFRLAIKTQDIDYLRSKYEIVNYPFEECPNCRMSNNIYWDKYLKAFFCRTCNIQTVGRVKKLTDNEFNFHDCRKYGARLILDRRNYRV